MTDFAQLKTRWQQIDAEKAAQFDAVRCAYISSMLARLEQPRHSENRILLDKVDASINSFMARFNTWLKSQADQFVNAESKVCLTPVDSAGSEMTGSPERASESLLDLLCSELNGAIEIAPTSVEESLDEMLYQQEQLARGKSQADLPVQNTGSGEQLELQSMKNFRQTMKYFNVDRLIERALKECPQNPGPHNPQMLAIKSLTTMQTLSPQYLRRFAGYIETMLWLEKNTARLMDKG